MIDAQPLPDGVRLCTSCGLCCTGALHDTAVLDEDEQLSAAALGLPVLEPPDRPAFALPCPQLQGTRCGIYLDRPRVCGRYKCNVLLGVEEGRTALPDALAMVHVARSLFGKVAAELGSGHTLPAARQQLFGAETPLPPTLRLYLLALTDYLDRHFRKPSEGRLLKSERVANTTSGEIE